MYVFKVFFSAKGSAKERDSESKIPFKQQIQLHELLEELNQLRLCIYMSLSHDSTSRGNSHTET